MGFDPNNYGPEIARILALDGNGRHALPITATRCRNEKARAELKQQNPKDLFRSDLFRSNKDVDASMAGLWLYFSCFEEAHELVNEPRTPEGIFWHAILHRLEPDSGNSAYWFRKLGQHPIYPALAQETKEILKRNPEAEFRIGSWDPFAFINFCERARDQPGSTQEKAALEIQLAEWQLLFDYSCLGLKVTRA